MDPLEHRFSLSINSETHVISIVLSSGVFFFFSPVLQRQTKRVSLRRDPLKHKFSLPITSETYVISILLSSGVSFPVLQRRTKRVSLQTAGKSILGGRACLRFILLLFCHSIESTLPLLFPLAPAKSHKEQKFPASFADTFVLRTKNSFVSVSALCQRASGRNG